MAALTGAQVEGFEKGNFIGPTVLDNVTPDMECYTCVCEQPKWQCALTVRREEIFGPVLVCLRADTLDEAIQLTNNNPYGNGCALFTRSGAAARKYQHEIDVGQVRHSVHVQALPLLRPRVLVFCPFICCLPPSNHCS